MLEWATKWVPCIEIAGGLTEMTIRHSRLPMTLKSAAGPSDGNHPLPTKLLRKQTVLLRLKAGLAPLERRFGSCEPKRRLYNDELRSWKMSKQMMPSIRLSKRNPMIFKCDNSERSYHNCHGRRIEPDVGIVD